jgi:maleate isomerase
MLSRRSVAIGILTPHATVGPEAELPEMAPGKIKVRIARVTTRPSAIDDAAQALVSDGVDAIGYASTSSAYVIGFDDEEALVARVSQRTGLPVASACSSAVLALRMLDVDRVALVHPPWFDGELNDLGAAYFRSQGFDVRASSSADLPLDPVQIRPREVVGWLSRHVHADAQAVFIGGNGFRAAGAIEAAEAAIGRPVLESNQVLLWNLLGRSGAKVRVRGYGRLFTA